MAFIRSWMSEALQATLAGFAIPFALLGLLAVFALGGGFGGLNSLGQLLAGPGVSLATPPNPASGRVHATRAAAVEALPTIPALGDVHTRRVTVGHRPATRAPFGRLRHYSVTAPQAPQPPGTGPHPARPPGGGGGPPPPPPCACAPPPPSQPLLPDPGSTVAGIQRQLTAPPPAPPSAPPSAAQLAPPDAIKTVTQLIGGAASAPKS